MSDLATPFGSRRKDRGLAIEELTDLVVDNLVLARPLKDGWSLTNPRDTFGPMDPIGFESEWDDDDERWFFNPEELTPEVLWPFDYTTVHPVNGEWQVNRRFSCTASQARGFTRIQPKYMAQIRVGYLKPGGGTLETQARFAGWMNGRFRPIDFGVVRHQKTDGLRGDWSGLRMRPDDAKHLAEIDDSVRMAMSMAFRARYLWHVMVGVEDGPQVRFETDPAGSMEIFRDRDRPETKDRRAALRNWVRAHWRRHRTDPSAESYVREHLRGATSFKWRGFDCRISPPQFDLEKSGVKP